MAGALGAAVAAALLGSCGGAGPVRVDPPHPPAAAAATCRALLAALPGTVQGQRARQVEPAGALAAAWGRPPIVLRCGVGKPAALNPASACFVADGVGWLAEQQRGGYRFTTIGRATYVEVSVPASDAPEADVLVDVAAPIRAHVRDVRPCA